MFDAPELHDEAGNMIFRRNHSTYVINTSGYPDRYRSSAGIIGFHVNPGFAGTDIQLDIDFGFLKRQCDERYE